MRRRGRGRAPAVFAEQEWLTGRGAQPGSALDVMLEAPVFASSARLDPSEIAWMLRQLGATSSSGVPLVGSLTMLSATQPGTPLGQLCDELAASASRGAGLAEALENHPETFSAATVSLVRSGEQVGSLGKGLRAAAEMLEEDADASRLIRRSLTYPVLSFLVVASLVVVLALVASPVLASVDSGSQLPWVTHLLLGAAEVAPLVLLPAAVVLVVLRSSLKITILAAAVRRRLDRWAVRTPGLSKLVRQRSQARLAAVMSWLLESGATPAEALRLAAPAAGNEMYVAAISRAADVATGGARLAEAIAGEPLFDAMLAAVARTGESAGTLPALLSQYADGARRESLQTAEAIAAVAEPLSCAVAGLVLLGWLAGLFIPVLQASALVP